MELNTGLRTLSHALARMLILLCVLSGVAIWVAPGAGAAVGISPVNLDFNEALRGGTFVQTLQLSNESSENTKFAVDDAKLLEFKVKADGEISSWILLTGADGTAPQTSFQVAKGERAILRVQVKVPADAANRKYTGTIFIEAVTVNPETKGQTGANAGSAAEIPVIVNVGGTERREARVDDFLVDGAEVGLKQRLTAKITNSGNVSVAAQLDVKVTRAGASVASLSTKGQNFPVFPAESGSVSIDWDTAEQQGGDYNADFTVTDVSGTTPIVLGKKIVAFRLEPRGTFTRSGEFTELTLQSQPEQGGLVVAQAVFLNTGKIATNAIFDGQISLNGKLIKTIQSLPRTVRPGETGPIGLTFDAVEAGRYRLSGKINFDGEVTSERVLELTIKPLAGAAAKASSGPNDGDGSSRTAIGIAAAMVATLIAGGVLLALRKRRNAGVANLQTGAVQ
jgi:hypothetical protein